jgi:hypothetical protein
MESPFREENRCVDDALTIHLTIPTGQTKNGSKSPEENFSLLGKSPAVSMNGTIGFLLNLNGA